MNTNISSKQYKDVVHKGFLIENEYLTKSSLHAILDKQKYITESYLKKQNKGTVRDILKHYEKDMKQHVEALMEYNKHYFHAIIETLEGRFEQNESRIDQIEHKMGV